MPRRDPLVRDVFDAYLLAMERAGDLSEGTMGICEQARRSLWPLLEGVRAASMGPDLTTRLLDEMQAREGLRISTARTRLGRLRRAWNWAITLRMVDVPWAAPAKSRARSRRRAAKADKHPYTPVELGMLLLSLDGPYHVALRLLVETGARLSEVMLLDCGDVRHDGSTWWATLTDAKSGMPRPVPLLDRTADLLDLRGPDEPLLLGTRGRRLHTGSVRKAMARRLDKFGIRRRVGPKSVGRSWSHDVHSTRRSFAAHGHEAGVDPLVLDRICGWTSSAMRDHYRRHGITERHMVDAVSRVAAWRDKRMTAQVLAASDSSSRRCTQAAVDPQGFHSGRLGTSGLEPLGTTTRTSGAEPSAPTHFYMARLAVKRATVRAPGCRGLILHELPEVFARV